MTPTPSSEFAPSLGLRWLPALEKRSAPISPEYSIPELTRRLAQGEEEAFRQFHRRFFERLRRFLLVVARGNEDEASEALQQTMLRVAKHAREFPSGEVFWDWLKTVARNVARDGGRKRGFYDALLRRFAFLADHDQGAAEADADVLGGLLDECLGELQEEERKLVAGKYIEGMRVRELAAAAGLTEKTVESRLGRIRADLRNRIMEKLRRL